MQPLTQEKLRQAQEIVRKVQIPAQPTVVIEIGREMKQEHPDFKKIGKLVSQDAALSARVLNVINSPFFGLARKVESIVQALALMGLNNFFNVVLTTCLRDALGGRGKDSDRMFWDHSMRTAMACEGVAKAAATSLMLDEISTDQAYMAGLFHDSGIPILLGRLPHYQPLVSLALSHKLKIPIAEDKMIGTDHCVIGHMMAKNWSVPEKVCQAILLHHASPAAEPDHDPVTGKLIAVVQLADYIAYCCDYSVGATGTFIEREWDIEEWMALHAAGLELLDLGWDEVKELKSETIERLLEH